MDLNSVLERARQAEKERVVTEQRSLHQRLLHPREALIESNCLAPATIDEYKAWLKGFLEQGELPTHVYDYPFGGFLVARRDCELPPLCGSQAMQVIVPFGITVTHAGHNHHTLFLMDGFRVSGLGFVPLYSDISF